VLALLFFVSPALCFLNLAFKLAAFVFGQRIAVAGYPFQLGSRFPVPGNCNSRQATVKVDNDPTIIFSVFGGRFESHQLPIRQPTDYVVGV
jgi:hypothetical protein